MENVAFWLLIRRGDGKLISLHRKKWGAKISKFFDDLSNDEGLSQRACDIQMITYEEALLHPNRHVRVRAIEMAETDIAVDQIIKVVKALFILLFIGAIIYGKYYLG